MNANKSIEQQWKPDEFWVHSQELNFVGDSDTLYDTKLHCQSNNVSNGWIFNRVTLRENNSICMTEKRVRNIALVQYCEHVFAKTSTFLEGLGVFLDRLGRIDKTHEL